MNRVIFGWRVVISCSVDWSRGLGWRLFRFEISKDICDPPRGAWSVRGIHYCGIRFMMSFLWPFHVDQWR